MKSRYIVEIFEHGIVTEELTLFNMVSAQHEAQGPSTADAMLSQLGITGLEVVDDMIVPVPRTKDSDSQDASAVGLQTFGTTAANEAGVGASLADSKRHSSLVLVEIPSTRLDELSAQPNIRLWPSSELSLGPVLVGDADVASGLSSDEHASTKGGLDIRPFRPGVPIEEIQKRLGVRRIWDAGFRGQNVVVAVVDEGVNGSAYPVVGGYDMSGWPKRPGSSAVTSHGSMCAAGVLVAAPEARIFDYPFMGVPDSFAAIKMMQAILDRRSNGLTPQVVNNSYGFYNVPERSAMPNHEVWDIEHPFHRKVRELVASGAAVFFAAGNCGLPSAAERCGATASGPGRSIHGANALPDVMTIAAVNSRYERIGYSSQGPSLAAPGFERDKPDLASFSHFFGNFGPGRPGGLAQPFDNGTSAATPVAAGVAALLLSAFPLLTARQVLAAMVQTATDVGAPGYDHDTGFGVINAGAAYEQLVALASNTRRFPARSTPGGRVF